MAHSTCACSTLPSSRWCPRADELFGVAGVHVLDVTSRDDGTIVLDVETGEDLAGCPGCGVVAVGHGRRVQVLHDAPCFGRPVRVRWRKRIWRCPEPACGRSTWTEDHPYASARAKLTTRAVDWAIDAAPRRHHGVRDRPTPRRRVGHLLVGRQGSGVYPARRPVTAGEHQDPRRGRTHLASLENLEHRQGRHGDGRPDPR